MDNLAGSIGLLLYQSICHHERIEEIAKNKISPMSCFHILPIQRGAENNTTSFQRKSRVFPFSCF